MWDIEISYNKVFVKYADFSRMTWRPEEMLWFDDDGDN
jgi:hypothetical protein